MVGAETKFIKRLLEKSNNSNQSKDHFYLFGYISQSEINKEAPEVIEPPVFPEDLHNMCDREDALVGIKVQRELQTMFNF